MKPDPNKEFVYLGIDGTKKYVKIGITRDIKRRQKEIQHMNPTFKMIYCFQPNLVTASESERFFHSFFENKRVVGEWFDLSLDEILIMTEGRGKYGIMHILGRRK